MRSIGGKILFMTYIQHKKITEMKVGTRKTGRREDIKENGGLKEEK